MLARFASWLYNLLARAGLFLRTHRRAYDTWAGLIATVAGVVSLWYFIASRSTGRPGLVHDIILGCWAFVPPAIFWFQYIFIVDPALKTTSPPRGVASLEDEVAIIDVSRNIWIGVAGVLAALYATT